jgi:nucleotide-binding universal stress UspA family protein
LSGEVTRSPFSLKKILVSTDGSENAKRALSAAIQLAKQNNSELIVLTVVVESIPASYDTIGMSMPPNLPKYFESAEREGRKIVDSAVEEAKKESVDVRGIMVTTVASVVQAIVESAEKEDVGLIVVGTRGLGGFRRLLLGSVSSGVVEHSSCAVLVVR